MASRSDERLVSCMLSERKRSDPKPMDLMTRQVTGTEDGIKERQAIFSACFGAAFIMLHPTKYAAMLAEKMQTYGATGWLVNTGRSVGRYGVGKRIKLPYTRKIIDAIHSGELLTANYHKAEVFGLEIPTAIDGVNFYVVESYYPSASGYKDEVLWAALWLHRATGGREYLDYVVSNADDFGGTGWGVSEFSWDIKYPGLQILASKNFELFASYKIGEDSTLTEEILAAGPKV
ncbi:hypothetical protein ZWY2020_051488 [Hordeum vulgare]|nr:hypothetical protein ZWY2020_051488 [Hordeum vulgare]